MTVIAPEAPEAVVRACRKKTKIRKEPSTQASAPAVDGPYKSLKRWISLRAYGLVTSTLFGATTSPLVARARFERFGRVSRKTLQRKFPTLVFQDHSIDGLA